MRKSASNMEHRLANHFNEDNIIEGLSSEVRHDVMRPMSQNDPQEKSAIRLRRAWELVDTRFNGVVARFAAALDKPQAQIRAWLYPNKVGGRNIGEKSARYIEAKLGLPRDWLDGDDSVSPFEQAAIRIRELEQQGVPEEEVIAVLDHLLRIARAASSRNN